jgi:hypothetical protein
MHRELKDPPSEQRHRMVGLPRQRLIHADATKSGRRIFLLRVARFSAFLQIPLKNNIPLLIPCDFDHPCVRAWTDDPQG